MHELLLHDHATRCHPRRAAGILPAETATLAARHLSACEYALAGRHRAGWRTPPRQRFMPVEPDQMEQSTLSTIQHWLRRKAVADAAHHFLFALFLLSVGAVLLAVIFFFACVLLWVALNGAGSALSELLWNRPLHLPLSTIAAVAGLFVVFLFIESARVSRQYLTRISRRNRSLSRSVDWTGGFVNLLVYSDIPSRLIADALLTGPRLVAGAWSCFRKAGRLARLDAEACSRVMAVLFLRASRCSFGDLAQLSGVPDPGKTASQLRDIDGVLFIHLDPPGMTFTSELRQKIAGALDLSAPPPPTRKEPKPVYASSHTIFELLGVPPTASPEEIDVAYRNWMAQSCARQAAELQNAARKQQLVEQVRAINAAYEAFLHAHKSDQIEVDTKQVETVWEQFKRAERR